ncbi:MAG: hypothetical protein C0498_05445 [Anaerolinea sp.]|nr:hypothetical protein [Anaerolinea sp.]
MTPRPVPVLALALTLAACGGAAGPEPPATDPPSSPVVPGTPPAATPHGEQVVGSATSIPYESFAQWAGYFDGVAIVRVVDVGAPRWSTPSGERPTEADLHASPTGDLPRPLLVIGRPITVELVREVRGAWPAPGKKAVWWVPGGRIGADELISTGPNLREPVIGELAVAFTAAQTYLPVPLTYIGSLFAADASGRVETFDSSEMVTLDTLDQALP